MCTSVCLPICRLVYCYRYRQRQWQTDKEQFTICSIAANDSLQTVNWKRYRYLFALFQNPESSYCLVLLLSQSSDGRPRASNFHFLPSSLYPSSLPPISPHPLSLLTVHICLVSYQFSPNIKDGVVRRSRAVAVVSPRSPGAADEPSLRKYRSSHSGHKRLLQPG